MNIKTIIAVVLIVLGVTAFAYQIISYTTLARDLAIGSMHAWTFKDHDLPLAAILGTFALIVGFALLLVDKSDFKPTATP